MNRILLITIAFAVVCFSGCKKNSGTSQSLNNNEVKVTVVVSPTSTITINATGSKAMMGCSFSGGGTYVDGTNEANASVYISLSAPGFSCVTNPGTYNFSCGYRKNVADPNTPIFSNNGISPGSITFTSINGHHMEGFFNAVCWCNSLGCVFGVDFVNVSGTFKGDY